jgi:hypothetical protein
VLDYEHDKLQFPWPRRHRITLSFILERVTTRAIEIPEIRLTDAAKTRIYRVCKILATPPPFADQAHGGANGRWILIRPVAIPQLRNGYLQ